MNIIPGKLKDLDIELRERTMASDRRVLITTAYRRKRKGKRGEILGWMEIFFERDDQGEQV